MNNWFTQYRVKPALPRGTSYSLFQTPKLNNFKMRLALWLFGQAAKLLPAELGWTLVNYRDEEKNQIGFLS